MRKYAGIGIVLLCIALPVMAQDYPKAEVFGGYQYTRSEGINLNGWNASLAGNFNHWFGIAADFSGAYKSESGVSLKVHSYTFGPVVSARNIGGVTPFVHALFGGFHASAGFAGASASTSGFAMQLGGGVDAKVSQHFAVRLVQADWMMLRAEGETSKKNGRVSAGLVYRF